MKLKTAMNEAKTKLSKPKITIKKNNITIAVKPVWEKPLDKYDGELSYRKLHD